MASQLEFLAARHEVAVVAPVGAASEREHLEASGVKVIALSSSASGGGGEKKASGRTRFRTRFRDAYFHLRHFAAGAGCDPEEVLFARGVLPAGTAADMIAREKCDCVVVAFPDFAYLREAIPGGIFCVYDSIEVRYTTWARRARYERSAHWRVYWGIESRRMRAYEALWANRYDLAVAISGRDEELLRDLGCSRVLTVPEGVRPARESAAAAPGHTALFLGNFTNVPNVDGLLWFARKVWPQVRRHLGDARLVVAGSAAPPEVREFDGRDGIEVVGFVDDLEDLFARTRVFVLPMRMGGGQKIKLVDAMGSGLPVVTTPRGCEGMNVISGTELLVAASPADFALYTIRVMESDRLARRLGASALARIRRDYDKKGLLTRFENELVRGVEAKARAI